MDPKKKNRKNKLSYDEIEQWLVSFLFLFFQSEAKLKLFKTWRDLTSWKTQSKCF